MKGKIGSDLEYAVQVESGGVKSFVPAGILPIEGTKGNPEPLLHGGLEIDCCAVEITPHEASTEDEFAGNIMSLLDEVRAKFPKVNLVTTPSVFFTKEALSSIRYANVMGCSPDFNAWSRKMNPPPRPRQGLRSFGGHIHIEHGTDETIKACDLVLGSYSVLKDPDQNRRQIYGRAGAFRPKPYGVEYRVLSNFWCGSEVDIRNIYRLVRKAQEITPEVAQLCNKFGGPKAIQAMINKSDKNAAKQVCDYFGTAYGLGQV